MSTVLSSRKMSRGISSSSRVYFSRDKALLVFIRIGYHSVKLATMYSSNLAGSFLVALIAVLASRVPTPVELSPSGLGNLICCNYSIGSASLGLSS